MREHSGHVISEFSVTLPVATVFFLVRIAQTGTRRGRTQHVFQAVSRGECVSHVRSLCCKVWRVTWTHYYALQISFQAASYGGWLGAQVRKLNRFSVS
jgi:hypothetical protein